MRSLAELQTNKEIKIRSPTSKNFPCFLPCIPPLSNKTLARCLDCSDMVPLPFKKKKVLERNQVQDQIDNVPHRIVKNFYVLCKSNRKYYVVLKWHSECIRTICHISYSLKLYLLLLNVV